MRQREPLYAYRPDNARVLEWLERTRRQRDPGLVLVRPDLSIARLHGDPRWPAFVAKMGLSDALR